MSNKKDSFRDLLRPGSHQRCKKITTTSHLTFCPLCSYHVVLFFFLFLIAVIHLLSSDTPYAHGPYWFAGCWHISSFPTFVSYPLVMTSHIHLVFPFHHHVQLDPPFAAPTPYPPCTRRFFITCVSLPVVITRYHRTSLAVVLLPFAVLPCARSIWIYGCQKFSKVSEYVRGTSKQAAAE